MTNTTRLDSDAAPSCMILYEFPIVSSSCANARNYYDVPSSFLPKRSALLHTSRTCGCPWGYIIKHLIGSGQGFRELHFGEYSPIYQKTHNISATVYPATLVITECLWLGGTYVLHTVGVRHMSHKWRWNYFMSTITNDKTQNKRNR